jgi:hypothetical protein
VWFSALPVTVASDTNSLSKLNMKAYGKKNSIGHTRLNYLSYSSYRKQKQPERTLKNLSMIVKGKDQEEDFLKIRIELRVS